MRLKQILLDSLDAAVAARLLPAYPRRARPALSPPGVGDVWSRQQLESVCFQDTGHPFYRDEPAWSRAVWLVEQFRGRGACGGEGYAWKLPHCFGLFQSMPAEDALHHVASALEAIGLRPSVNAILHEGEFEMTDQVKVRDLPAFYGNWLIRAFGNYPWDDAIHFRLAIVSSVEMVYLARTGSEPVRTRPVLTLRLTAPAAPLVNRLGSKLASLLAPTGSALRPDQLLLNMIARQFHLAPSFLLS